MVSKSMDGFSQITMVICVVCSLAFILAVASAATSGGGVERISMSATRAGEQISVANTETGASAITIPSFKEDSPIEIWEWQTLGEGISMDGVGSPIVNAFAVFEGDLYVAGQFDKAGGQTVNNIARWDGTEWHALPGLNGHPGVLPGEDPFTVSSLIVYNDELYIGGNFSSAGGLAVLNVAKWDGMTIGPIDGVGSGVDAGGCATLCYVTAMEVFGGKLYIAGTFNCAGPAEHQIGTSGLIAFSTHPSGIAEWLNPQILTSGTCNDVLFCDLLPGWEGSSPVKSLLAFTDASGEALYVSHTEMHLATECCSACPAIYKTVHRLDAGWMSGQPEPWSPIGSTCDVISGGSSMVLFDDGNGDGQKLYVRGVFDLGCASAGITKSGVVRWNPTGSSSDPACDPGVVGAWEPVDCVPAPSSGQVTQLYVADIGDGFGSQLYIMRSADIISGNPKDEPSDQMVPNSRGIERWNGESWSGLGQGLLPPIGPGGSGADYGRSVIYFTDRNGDAGLFVGGWHGGGVNADGSEVPSPGVVKWVRVSTPDCPPSDCLGDINGDGVIDANDLGLLLEDYGKTGKCLPADLNQDGVVDADDLAILMGEFGQSCEP